MKKMMSLLLVIVLVMSLTSPAMAVKNEKPKLDVALAHLQQQYPGATITVSEEEVISVVLPSSDIAPFAAASIYAPDGGSWRNFTAPIGSDPYGTFPYGIVYLPGEETSMLSAAKDLSGIIPDVVMWAADKGTAAAVGLLAAKYGISASVVGIMFLVSLQAYSYISWVDQKSLSAAARRTGKVSIELATCMGYPAYFYRTWDGTYVTDSPYESWGPSFYRGVYDVAL